MLSEHVEDPPLLTLELPIARITGYVAIIEGLGTSWALAIALLWGKLAFA